MSLDDAYYKVREFHKAFGAPFGDVPSLIGTERGLARAEWMREEVDEFLSSDTIIDQADAMIDLIYFALGTLVEMGVQPEKLFDIVHRANMTKLWPDGTVHYNELGKVIKHESWENPAPRLEAEVQRQIDEGT